MRKYIIFEVMKDIDEIQFLCEKKKKIVFLFGIKNLVYFGNRNNKIILDILKYSNWKLKKDLIDNLDI